MSANLTPEDRIVLDRLLTQLAGRLDGAIDFWTIVCLASLPPDPLAFVRHHGDIMRALIVVIRALYPSAARDKSESIGRELEAAELSIARLQESFETLGQFRVRPLEEVRSASLALAEAYHGLRQSLRELRRNSNLPASDRDKRREEREDYFDGILRGLFDQLCHERDTASLAAALPQGTS